MPTCETLRPVAAPLVLIIDEFGKLHRLSMFPIAVVVPILGDARFRAATGASQNSQARMLANKVDQAASLSNLS